MMMTFVRPPLMYILFVRPLNQHQMSTDDRRKSARLVCMCVLGRSLGRPYWVAGGSASRLIWSGGVSGSSHGRRTVGGGGGQSTE
jgi:hypothetical protein